MTSPIPSGIHVREKHHVINGKMVKKYETYFAPKEVCLPRDVISTNGIVPLVLLLVCESTSGALEHSVTWPWVIGACKLAM
jgi:hypothetical protein